MQALAVTAIKYLVVAMIIANWASVFRDVNGSFNAVANFIGSSSGASDMFLNWMTQLQQQALLMRKALPKIWHQARQLRESESILVSTRLLNEEWQITYHPILYRSLDTTEADI